MRNHRLHSLLKRLGKNSNGQFNGAATPSESPVKQSWRQRLWKRGRRIFNTRQSLRKLWSESPLRLINRFLLFLAVAATVAMPLFLWYDAEVLAGSVTVHEPGDASSELVMQPAKSGNPSVRTIAARRRYFRSKGERLQQAANPLNAAEVPGLAQRYTLLGVLMGEVPQAIVQDNSTNATQFLTKGETIGGYEVQEIFSDRVLLQRDGDLVNLRL
ncbi:MAG: type II secretion system protein N [bacterium]